MVKTLLCKLLEILIDRLGSQQSKNDVTVISIKIDFK